MLNPLPKGVVFERNGHRLGDTTLGNVTTPGEVVKSPLQRKGKESLMRINPYKMENCEAGIEKGKKEC